MDFSYAASSDSVYRQAVLDDAGRTGAPLVTIGYGPRMNGEVPHAQHGWDFRWINKKGMGNHGSLVVVPTDRRTRAIRREGRMARYLAAGFSQAEAGALCGARLHRREELSTWIYRLASDRTLRRALQAFPGVGPGLHHSWRAAWGPVVDEVWKCLTKPRLAALAGVAKALPGD